MNKESILRKLLEDEELKKEFWPKEDIDKLNSKSLIRCNSKELKFLYQLFDDGGTDKRDLLAIQKLYKLVI